MVDLTFADSHNMVAYLEKSEDNADFAEIVDFLNASPIRYALTVNPTVYVSYIEQFWSTAMIKILPDENQILLKIPRKDNMYSFDMKNIVPKESLTCLVAKATLDESMLWHRRLGHNNFKNINKLVKDNLVSGLPTNHFENDQTCVACLKGKQHRASCTYVSPPARQGYQYWGDSPTLTRVLALENIKTAQDLEITNLKKRVKKLEMKKKSELPQSRGWLFKICTIVCDVSAASPIRPVDDSIIDDITLAETLMKIKTSRPQSQESSKDKEKRGKKGIMQEPKKLVKVKGKDQIEYDTDVAQRLQAELDEEARLEREREKEASKAVNIAEWDDV
ncbi:putative ribonuclease H-like domain-containing protein [Tanacetum coccineum]